MRGSTWVATASLWGACFFLGCGSAPPGTPPLAGLTAPVTRSSADGIGTSADDLRTGWYPDQAALAPARVSAPDFGQLFDTPIDGQVYAQPLVANGTLLVVTETNNVYALDPTSGTILQTRRLHPPWNAADLGCPDLAPSVGITGTPAIDPSTNTAYFFAKTYVSGTTGPAAYWAHAVDVASLQERPGFPVLIQGQAANQVNRTFDATHHVQRPGILLLGGVAYAAFAGHCDIAPYQGWLVGVSSAGVITTLWAAEDQFNEGAGIWQTGGAPLSDGPGTFIVATGNGEVPSTPTPGNQPPNTLGQAWVRLRVQGNGSLQATDFFMPYDAASLNTWDADFGSGGPVGLPDSFGTPSHPHLGIGVGKQGYVYLLDRDNLGGLGQGMGGGDEVVQRIGPYGGVWSKPAVWPGNGGWVYLPTASGGITAGGSNGTFDVYQAGQDGSGNPTLARVGQALDPFGFGSSAPVVTSDGTTPGSALAWIIWSADGTGVGGQLRAYDAIPSASGTLNLRYSAPIGQANKFTPPGVAGGRIYVGTRDGHLKAFGSPVNPVLTAPPTDFGVVTVGSSTTKSVVFTAARAATVNGVTAQADFTVLSTQPPTPASLAAGQSITANVSFTPSQTGVRAAALVANTDQGPASTSLTGTGQLVLGKLQAAPTALSFGGTALGRVASGAVTFSNVGGAPLTVRSVTPPLAPFSISGAPAPGASLAPGQSVTVTMSFTPVVSGPFTGSITVDTDVDPVEVPMSGSAGPPGNLQITPSSLDFGQVSVGDTVTRSFTVQNTGGVRITLTKSKPPGSSVGFGADSQLAEGTTVDPGASQTLQVHFTPDHAGPAQDQWVITADDGNGPQTVLLSGNGGTGSGGTGSATGGCGTPGPVALWPLLTLLPWAFRRRPEAR